MTTTHTNLALVEGEVYILGKMASGKIGDTIFCTIDKKICRLLATYASYSCSVLASTAKLDCIPQLDRTHFVKPFDMKSMQDAYIHENNYYNYEDKERDIIKSAFEDGFNAKEAEFTMEDMEMLWKHAISEKLNFEQAIELIHPISLPASINTDENFNVISVQWE